MLVCFSENFCDLRKRECYYLLLEPENSTGSSFNPKDNCRVCCWVMSGISTSSDFDVNTVHHDNTNDTGEDHIDENIVRQPINVGQWVLI